MNQQFNDSDSLLGLAAHRSRFTAAASQLRIALIASSWHQDIVGKASASCVAELLQLGLPAERVELFALPGAFEIPLHAKALAASRRFDAIIACGLVVDGGIYRHDFVATAVIDGLMRVQLDSDVPVFSAVLTPHHFHEHGEHQGYFAEHFVKKGREVAQACALTLGARLALRNLSAA